LPEQSVFHDSWLFCYPDVDALFKVAGFSLHTSVVPKALERDKLERLAATS
jgi:hypothetical protein